MGLIVALTGPLSRFPIGVSAWTPSKKGPLRHIPTVSRTKGRNGDEHEHSFLTFAVGNVAERVQKWTLSGVLAVGLAITPPFSMLVETPFLPAAYAEATTTSVVNNGSAKTEDPLTLSPVVPAAAQINAFDEVWTLIDKYFIDRSFNKQDWDHVRDVYEPLYIKANGNEDKQMKIIKEMVSSLGDKYSRVLDKQQYTAIQRYDLIGIGVTFMPNEKKEIIVGAPPIEDSASARAGLKQGDVISSINGVSTRGRTAFDIIDQIGEDPGAKTITLTVRPSADPTREYSVTMERAFQNIKDPIVYKLSEKRADGTKVGYIRILEFNSLVKSKLEDALQDLEAMGANAYVLDLRQNTGGAFQSAVEVAGLFMKDQIATYVVDSSLSKLSFRTPKDKLAVDTTDPMVVWIDGSTASASEVLAGSLHDNCRAVLMGDTSFGKGLIQAVYGLKNGSGLVLTVARYVTPSGIDIQGTGIKPDIDGPGIIPRGLPGIVTPVSTSKVDFDDIRTRLGPSMCTPPTGQ